MLMQVLTATPGPFHAAALTAWEPRGLLDILLSAYWELPKKGNVMRTFSMTTLCVPLLLQLAALVPRAKLKMAQFGDRYCQVRTDGC